MVHNENQKHQNDEHHLIIVKMVQDYLGHHDQANQNLTNELSGELHLSKLSKEKEQFILEFFLEIFTKRFINSNFR